MQVNLEPGKYVVAVSGGVDSVALLHMLVQQSQIKEKRLKRKDAEESFNFQLSTFNSTNLKFVVAHLDHGIRPDSAVDAVFVMELAEKYGLPFIGGSVHLGPDASEDTARKCRYDFLKIAARDSGANAIVTAHHQDDLIETAAINTLRGTGRKGLSSLSSSAGIRRPLLGVSKQEILDYAKQNKLTWHEDSTNQDTKYLRNRVRKDLNKNLDPQKRASILKLLEDMRKLNVELDEINAKMLAKYADSNNIQKDWFVALPQGACLEVLAYWLRVHKQIFDRKSLERLVNHIKTGQSGTRADVGNGSYILIGKHQISLIEPKSL